MENVNWANYKDDALDFVYSESSKMLDETFKSFREASNKAFIALAIYAGIISYCFNQILKIGFVSTSIPYIIMILGIVIAIRLLWSNLMPGKMNVPGAIPSQLLSSYFEQEQFKEKQKREMIITKLVNYDQAIKHNIKQAVVRAKRLKQSAIIFLIFLCLSLASRIMS